MKSSIFFSAFSFFLLQGTEFCASTVHIITTAALIDKKYEERKQEYIHSLTILKGWGYEPFVVESCSNGPTFLNDYSNHVLYSGTNNRLLRNKGVNELLALRAAFKKFPFDDDDIIIKLTGRYYFSDQSFLQYVQQNSTLDAFVKYDSQLDMIFTGCFALRARYFKHMIESINLQEMEDRMMNFESVVARYINNLYRKGEIKGMFLDHLGVVANIFGDGNCNLTIW